MTESLAFKYGKRRLLVDVEFNGRKRLSITVHPDCRITAKAPAGYELQAIEARLEKRRAWIARQLDYFEQFQPVRAERKYVSGETHYYLGRQYRLRIRSGQTPKVRLIGPFFQMEMPQPDDREKAHQLMNVWYSIHVKDLMTKRLDLYWPVFKRRGSQYPAVRFRQMKKRWGSYSKRGAIMLNTDLVKAPLQCIDYVIVHELCHTISPNHDTRFYRTLSRILPDWEKRKERLEKASSWIAENLTSEKEN